MFVLSKHMKASAARDPRPALLRLSAHNCPCRQAGPMRGADPWVPEGSTLNSGRSPQAMLPARTRAHRAPACAKEGRIAALACTLERLAAWQASRMGRTYADLAAQPRYADAIAFFQSDLYGASDFAQRDADLARVVPIMTRMLPARVIATVAQAMELNALSRELDRALLQRQFREATAGSRSPSTAPPTASRGNAPARDRQIQLHR